MWGPFFFIVRSRFLQSWCHRCICMLCSSILVMLRGLQDEDVCWMYLRMLHCFFHPGYGQENYDY